jgi:two-component system, NarL family, response regulator LiaR
LPIKVLLADDHAVLREGTREMVERDPDLEVVGEAANGPQTIALARDLSPDVVLLDLALPLANGIEVTREIRSWPAGPRVLMLSAYDDQDYVRASIDAGANGYLAKTATMSEIISGIRAVARGEIVLHPAMITRLLARDDRAHVERLTSRELEVMALAVQGVRNKEIAKTLFLSPRTVEAHFTSIFNKLGVSSRTEAVVQGISNGWLALRREPPLD